MSNYNNVRHIDCQFKSYSHQQAQHTRNVYLQCVCYAERKNEKERE